MSLPYHARPGAGLIVMGVSLLGVAWLFAWGFATPPLDDVWRMQIELGLGEAEPLTGREFRLLQDTLQRYPALADHMLEGGVAGLVSANQKGVVDVGYAYLVRKRPDTPGKLQLTALGDKRVGLQVRTLTSSAAGETRHAATYTWQLPSDGPFPQLVEVRLDGERRSAQRRQKQGLEPQADAAPRPVMVTLTP